MADSTISRRAWVVVCAVLAGTVVYQWRGTVQMAPPVTAVELETLSIDAAEPVTFEPPPVDVISPIVDRPLFAASRRPSQSEEPAAAEVESDREELLDLRLLGTMVTDDFRAALLRQGGGGIRRLRLGDDLCGWRIARIDKTGVTFTRDGEMFRLDLPKPTRQQTKERSTSIRCALRAGKRSPGATSARA